MKWGILATGTIAKKFASTVEQMGAEGEQLVAVGSRHMESAQAFAQQYGIPRCYDSYEALAADPEVIRCPVDRGYRLIVWACSSGEWDKRVLFCKMTPARSLPGLSIPRMSRSP